MDYARILYNKGLYHQSLKVLDKLKEQAKAITSLPTCNRCLFFEKKIEALYITRSMQDRAEQLSTEADEVSNSLVAGIQTVESFVAIVQLVYQERP